MLLFFLTRLATVFETALACRLMIMRRHALISPLINHYSMTHLPGLDGAQYLCTQPQTGCLYQNSNTRLDELFVSFRSWCKTVFEWDWLTICVCIVRQRTPFGNRLKLNLHHNGVYYLGRWNYILAVLVFRHVDVKCGQKRSDSDKKRRLRKMNAWTTSVIQQLSF